MIQAIAFVAIPLGIVGAVINIGILRFLAKRERRSILNQRNAITRMDSAEWPQW